MQGVLGCALQNTYTFCAKGPSAVRLQPAEKKPRKFLFTISNTLEKGWNSHTKAYHLWCECLSKKKKKKKCSLTPQWEERKKLNWLGFPKKITEWRLNYRAIWLWLLIYWIWMDDFHFCRTIMLSFFLYWSTGWGGILHLLALILTCNSILVIVTMQSITLTVASV